MNNYDVFLDRSHIRDVVIESPDIIEYSGITRLYIDDNGNLVVVYDSGDTQIVGHVQGDAGTSVVGSRRDGDNLIIEFSDGTEVTLQNMRGPQGNPGDLELIDPEESIVVLTDGDIDTNVLGTETYDPDGAVAEAGGIPAYVESHGGGGGRGGQVDWNENDSTSPEYIKNRICYESVTTGTMYEKEIMLEDDGGVLAYMDADATYIDLSQYTEDSNFTISFDDASYQCKPYVLQALDEFGALLGNFELLGPMFADHPNCLHDCNFLFVIVNDTNGEGMCMVEILADSATVDADIQHIVELSGVVRIASKIDGKYVDAIPVDGGFFSNIVGSQVATIIENPLFQTDQQRERSYALMESVYNRLELGRSDSAMEISGDFTNGITAFGYNKDRDEIFRAIGMSFSDLFIGDVDDVGLAGGFCWGVDRYGMYMFSGTVDTQGNDTGIPIHGVMSPSENMDATNKKYVDDLITSMQSQITALEARVAALEGS